MIRPQLTGGPAWGPPDSTREGEPLAHLITGIGYIGARLAEDLLEAGEEVVGVENFFSTDRRAVARLERHPGFHLIRGSMNSPNTLTRAFAARPIEVVYSLAAQASAHPQAASARYTEVTNLLSPRLLFDLAARHRVRRVVYGSSLRVYGDLPLRLADEDSPYGRFADLSHLSKVYVEKLAEMYAHERGLQAVAVRLGLVYGLGPVMKSDYRFLTAPNKFCLLAAQGEPLVVTAGGLRPQGLLHVADAARGLRFVAALPDLPPYFSVNLATESATIRDVAGLVADLGASQGLAVEVQGPSDEGVGESAIPGDALAHTLSQRERAKDAPHHPSEPEAAEATAAGVPPSRLWERCFVASRFMSEGLAETLAYYREALGSAVRE